MTIAGYEQDCGVLRVQALSHGDEMCERVEGALGVASRHLDRIRSGWLQLSPAVAKEIESSIARARALVGVGAAIETQSEP